MFSERCSLIAKKLTDFRKSVKMKSSEKSHKVILLGDSKCGKTSLWKRYVEGETSEQHIPTVFDSSEVKVLLENKEVKLTIWDTSGSSEFDHVRSLSFSGVDLFVLCFDVNLPESLENIQSKWFKEAKTTFRDTPVILCGCKCDLQELNKCDRKMIERIIQQTEPFAYIECSSRKNKNIDDIFKTISLLAIGEVNKIKNEFKCRTKKNVSQCCIN